MFYLDNSETSWLVYADWLEDQDIDASFIRQEIVEPTTDQWVHEYQGVGVGGIIGLIGLGGLGGLGKGVGNPTWCVGAAASNMGCVGGSVIAGVGGGS